MSSNIINTQPYLITSRKFPKDASLLSDEVDRTYVDIASKMNQRVIGVFATVPSITGEIWFTGGGNEKQQTIRRIYEVTGAGTIAHGFDLTKFSKFTRIYGAFTDSSNPNPALWESYPLPYINVVAANNQVSITLTSSNIVITAGSGSPPTISSGYVVLELLSQV